MEDDIEEGAVHVQLAIVVDEAQLPELIHEVTDTGADFVEKCLRTEWRGSFARHK